eukprot:RCo023546
MMALRTNSHILPSSTASNMIAFPQLQTIKITVPHSNTFSTTSTRATVHVIGHVQGGARALETNSNPMKPIPHKSQIRLFLLLLLLLREKRGRRCFLAENPPAPLAFGQGQYTGK